LAACHLERMLNVKQAFEFQPDDKPVPVGYKWIPLQMIFNVKIDFMLKARLVARGHLTDPPTTLTYSSVVPRESVRLAFLIAALNDLNILVADIGNAYINAMTKEKVYTAAGKEFGDCAGQTIIITRALYGLKSSGAVWRLHLAQTLRDMDFKSSYVDPDIWMRVVYKEDGTSFYEYMLCYVDDLLCISADPAAILGHVEQTYQLK
jgi:Reverse transcriptase (RNA-dependent DNA polymerase)